MKPAAALVIIAADAPWPLTKDEVVRGKIRDLHILKPQLVGAAKVDQQVSTSLKRVLALAAIQRRDHYVKLRAPAKSVVFCHKRASNGNR
jgi:hypothetical protein